MRRIVTAFVEDHPTLFAFILCGGVGVFVDADHLLILFFPVGFGRVWHLPLLIVCGGAFCCLGAFATGLLVKLVLKRFK